jgi:hypothetical protein
MLSPLSWWNDLFFNLPIALVLGYLASWLQPSWLLPGTVVGYWLSNVLGIVMMQFGATDMFWAEEPRHLKRDLIIGLSGSTLYTIVVSALVYWHILQVPDILTDIR